MNKDTALRLALEALSTSMYPQPRQLNAIAAIKAALEAKDEKANDELRRLHDLLGKANALARIRANKIDELEQRLTKTEAQLGEAVWNYGELKREQLANQQKTSGSPINTSTALEAKDEPVGEVLNERGEVDYISYVPPVGTALYTTPPKQEAKDEPVPVAIVEVFGKDWRLDYMALPVGKHKLYAQQYLYTTLPPQRTWVGLTKEELKPICDEWRIVYGAWMVDFARDIEIKLKEKNT